MPKDQSESIRCQISQHLARHQIPGNDQEHIDADKSSGEPRYLQVIAKYSQHRERPEGVDV